VSGHDKAAAFVSDVLFGAAPKAQQVRAWVARAVSRYSSWRASETGLLSWLSHRLAYGRLGAQFKTLKDRRSAFLFAKEVLDMFKDNNDTTNTNETRNTTMVNEIKSY